MTDVGNLSSAPDLYRRVQIAEARIEGLTEVLETTRKERDTFHDERDALLIARDLRKAVDEAGVPAPYRPGVESLLKQTYSPTVVAGEVVVHTEIGTALLTDFVARWATTREAKGILWRPPKLDCLFIDQGDDVTD
jgi:hypothetical protein